VDDRSSYLLWLDGLDNQEYTDQVIWFNVTPIKGLCRPAEKKKDLAPMLALPSAIKCVLADSPRLVKPVRRFLAMMYPDIYKSYRRWNIYEGIPYELGGLGIVSESSSKKIGREVSRRMRRFYAGLLYGTTPWDLKGVSDIWAGMDPVSKSEIRTKNFVVSKIQREICAHRIRGQPPTHLYSADDFDIMYQ
jgi:hypothetical protein